MARIPKSLRGSRGPVAPVVRQALIAHKQFLAGTFDTPGLRNQVRTLAAGGEFTADSDYLASALARVDDRLAQRLKREGGLWRVTTNDELIKEEEA